MQHIYDVYHASDANNIENNSSNIIIIIGININTHKKRIISHNSSITINQVIKG